MTPLDDAVLGDDTTEPATLAAPNGSPLDRIRRQRARLLDESDSLHIQVPRTSDPQIYVAYKPIDPDVAEETMSRHQKAAKKRRGRGDSRPGWVVRANADLLVNACHGVYWLDDDGKEHGLAVSNEDDWPRYDHRLAEALKVEETSAIEVCRALFTTDADLVTHCAELVELSGFDRDQLEERFKGE